MTASEPRPLYRVSVTLTPVDALHREIPGAAQEQLTGVALVEHDFDAVSQRFQHTLNWRESRDGYAFVRTMTEPPAPVATLTAECMRCGTLVTFPLEGTTECPACGLSWAIVSAR
jgi:hypothetical protein